MTGSDTPPLDVKGSCLCGAVTFRCTRKLSGIQLCHCSRCRKASGSAFVAALVTSAAGFAWLTGEKRVVSYEVPMEIKPPGYIRVFCNQCGGPLPIRHPGTDFYIIPAGCFDDDPGVRPARHIFTAAMAPWYQITDGLPQYERHVPDVERLEAEFLES